VNLQRWDVNLQRWDAVLPTGLRLTFELELNFEAILDLSFDGHGSMEDSNLRKRCIGSENF
jgi:hypothetical protein